MQRKEQPTYAGAHALVQEVLRTGFTLIEIMGNLVEELEDGDSFPDEDPAVVVLEMVAGSFLPACAAAGEGTVEAATALVGALSDRTVYDLKAALEISRSSSE